MSVGKYIYDNSKLNQTHILYFPDQLGEKLVGLSCVEDMYSN